MSFESPQRKCRESDDCAIQFTPKFKAQQMGSSAIRIVFNYSSNNKLELVNSADRNCRCLPMSSDNRSEEKGTGTVSGSMKTRLQLSSGQHNAAEESISHSAIKSKLKFIYNQFSKENDCWSASFEAFCLKENMDISELKHNSPIQTYSAKQSFITSNEIFWLLAINCICITKKGFSLEDLIALTHLAIDSVKNSSFVLNKCYMRIVNEFKAKERNRYCCQKGIPLVRDSDCLKLLNDNRHFVTKADKSDGSMINANHRQSKRVKVFNDINNVSIFPFDKENNSALPNRPRCINPFTDISI